MPTLPMLEPMQTHITAFFGIGRIVAIPSEEIFFSES